MLLNTEKQESELKTEQVSGKETEVKMETKVSGQENLKAIQQNAFSQFDRRTFLRKLVFSAAMVALGAALAYVPRLIWRDSTFRPDFAILPIMVIANLFGPIWSGSAYVMTDLIGCLIDGYLPFLPITLCKAVCGLLFGVAFGNKKLEWKRVLIASVIIGFLVDFVLMVPTMKLYYWFFGVRGEKVLWTAIIIARTVTTGVNIVTRFLFTTTIGASMQMPLLRMMKKERFDQ